MNDRIVITGMGAQTSVGFGVAELAAALRAGRSGIEAVPANTRGPLRVAALLPPTAANPAFSNPPPSVAPHLRSVLRNVPASTTIACAAALEAYRAAALEEVADRTTIAVIVAGNNIQQAYTTAQYREFLEKPSYAKPRYAVNFLDTHLVGAISELLTLHGFGFTTGGSSASSNMALFQALHLLRSGQAEICVCVGALADYSELEFQALLNLGAMTSAPLPEPPAAVCRPFDQGHSGFVYGQGSGCVILERLTHAQQRGVEPLAELAGAAVVLDGNQGADPNVVGETRVMRQALQQAACTPAEIDYINAHGSSSMAGDQTECEAIRAVFGAQKRPLINATKALLGHTLYAASMLEAISTVIQLREQFVHPNPHLDQPIAPDLGFVGKQAQAARLRVALSNAFSFGGINTAVVLRTLDDHKESA